ncbi:unnamed protein product [Closterium sp. Yama58-4]|nr:unnamed protein product [Closterium sp. Yama58-4]
MRGPSAVALNHRATQHRRLRALHLFWRRRTSAALSLKAAANLFGSSRGTDRDAYSRTWRRSRRALRGTLLFGNGRRTLHQGDTPRCSLYFLPPYYDSLPTILPVASPHSNVASLNNVASPSLPTVASPSLPIIASPSVPSVALPSSSPSPSIPSRRRLWWVHERERGLLRDRAFCEAPSFQFFLPVGPSALAPNALAPNALAPNALAPNALAPCALAPYALAPNALAPCALAPWALAPCALAPYALAPCALAPYALAPCALAPNALAPCALAPCALAPCALAPCALAPCALAPCALAPCALAPYALAPCVDLVPKLLHYHFCSLSFLLQVMPSVHANVVYFIRDALDSSFKPHVALAPCCGALAPCCGALAPCCGALAPCCGALAPCCGALAPCCGALAPYITH